MLSGFGWTEAIIIILIVMLLFGGRKLPELARGTGRALRIFKSETKGLMDDDDEDEDAPKKNDSASEPPQITHQPTTQAKVVDPSQPTQPRQQPDA